MIVEVEDEVPVLDDFRWLTLGEIKKLQGLENFVNMDARSVLSCIPYFKSEFGPEFASGVDSDANAEDIAAGLLETRSIGGFERALLDSMHPRARSDHSMDALLAWVTEMKARYELATKPIPLVEASCWNINEREIVHESQEHFSVIAVAVEAGNREVASWTQPLVKDTAPGLHGFITQKHGGVLHFLVQAKVEPGNIDVVDLAPTVSCSNLERRQRRTAEWPQFLEYFLEVQPDQVRYSVVQSEEGGRFFQLENRNVILEVEESKAIEVPDPFVWMTLAQLLELMKHGYLSVDARTLLSCLSWA